MRSRCISVRSRGGGGEAGARHSEFGCRGSHLRERLNLTWSEPPYNLRKRLDVLVTIHIFWP